MPCPGAMGPERRGLYLAEGKLADEHTGGFKVDPFMFDPHQDHPCRAVPTDRQVQRHLFNKMKHLLLYFLTVRFDIADRWPWVMLVIQVIPAHFIHSDSHHGLERGINTGVEISACNQLINIKGCSMGIIENKRMPQRNSLCRPGIRTLQAFKQALIQFPAVKKIFQDLLTFF